MTDPAPVATAILRHVMSGFEACSDEAFVAALANAGLSIKIRDLSPEEIRRLYHAFQFLELDGGGGHHAKYWDSHTSLTGLSDEVHQLVWKVAQAMVPFGLAKADLNKIRNKSYGHDRLQSLEVAEAAIPPAALFRFLGDQNSGFCTITTGRAL